MRFDNSPSVKLLPTWFGGNIQKGFPLADLVEFDKNGMARSQGPSWIKLIQNTKNLTYFIGRTGIISLAEATKVSR